MSEAETFAFGSLEVGVYGVARAGRSDGRASGLGLLFDGGEVAAVRAESEAAEGGPAAGVETVELEPGHRWRVTFADAFALEFEALAPPAELTAGGFEGREQLCRVRGTAAGRPVSCLGQRGLASGRPDWERVTLARSVSAWLGEDRAVAVTAVRGARARDHAGESVAAGFVLDGAPVGVDEARISTTYDAGGRQRHAGLELFLAPDGYPHRVAGEAVCGTTLDLGRLRLDTAFFRWHSEGRTGTGRYDLVRHAEPR